MLKIFVNVVMPVQHTKSHWINPVLLCNNKHQRVGMDIMGLFPETDRRTKYVLCAMDCVTKWLEAYALPDLKWWQMH